MPTPLRSWTASQRLTSWPRNSPVPYQQTADLTNAMRAANPVAYVDNVQLAAGTIPFAHGRVTQDALNDFYGRETRLVAPVSTTPSP